MNVPFDRRDPGVQSRGDETAWICERRVPVSGQPVGVSLGLGREGGESVRARACRESGHRGEGLGVQPPERKRRFGVTGQAPVEPVVVPADDGDQMTGEIGSGPDAARRTGPLLVVPTVDLLADRR